MAQQQTLNITQDLNNNSIVQLDIGGWDYAVVQLVTPTGTFTFNSTNDSGAITSSSDGSAASATNWITVQGTNLNSGAAVTTLATSGMVRFQSIGQFLQIAGAAAAQVTKALVRLYKIN
jgi:Tfp pilus assembly protein FimT